jgi:NAD(P)-dependent dehydrogenase (short-subunit alcohol dehydrogenase family)
MNTLIGSMECKLVTTYDPSNLSEYVINNDTEVVKSGGRSYFLRADIRNRKQIQTVIQTIHDKFGRLDIAVNNAGISGPLGNLNELDLDQYFFQEHDPIQNNLYGTINCMQEEIKYWISRKDTKSTYSIVNLSSYNGIRGCQGCSLYSASKFGIIGVTKSVAIEFAVATETTPRIRINAVAPGLIETSLTWNQVKFVVNQTQPWIEPYIDRDTFAPYREEFASGLLGKRLGEDFEIASMITYLSSDDASYVSGTVLSVDNAENAK